MMIRLQCVVMWTRRDATRFLLSIHVIGDALARDFLFFLEKKFLPCFCRLSESIAPIVIFAEISSFVLDAKLWYKAQKLRVAKIADLSNSRLAHLFI